MTRRLLPIAVLALLAGSLAACGNKTATITRGESEASYVTLGKLQYQVQLSRQLNPAFIGDRDYLVGLSPVDRTLKSNEVLFAIWLRRRRVAGASTGSA